MVAIGRGERAPDFVLPRGPEGAGSRFYGHAGGRPTALVFTGAEAPDTVHLCERLRRDDAADVHLVLREGHTDTETTWLDVDGGVHQSYGVRTTGTTVVVLDPNLRATGIHEVGDDGDTADAVADLSAAAIERPSATVRVPAPVLFVPDALDAELCQQVVAAWQSADPADSGVETMADGRRVDALDALQKRRRDLVVRDRDLLRTLTQHVGRRVVPEVQKAFAFGVDRFEGFKIGAYDAADAGFFHAHRDNLSPATAHRAFALSLNLNDDFEGGELRFPEYGPERYRPSRGEALVFSGAHLHEVLPVTRGRRFVLLSFLYRG